MSLFTRPIESPRIPPELRCRAPRQVRRRASHGAFWLGSQILIVATTLALSCALMLVIRFAVFRSLIWRDGVAVNGVVTAVKRGGKETWVSYKFAPSSGESTQYSGSFSVPTGNSALSFAMGQQLQIKYLPSNANQSLAVEELERDELWLGLFFYGALLGVATFGAWRKLFRLWHYYRLLERGTPVVVTLEKVTVDSTVGPARKIVTLRAHFHWRDNAGRVQRASQATYQIKPPLEPGQRLVALMSPDGKTAVIYALCPFEVAP